MPPFIKKGISDPKVDANEHNVSWSKFKSHNLLRPINVAAALLDPPANPAPIGIFFLKNIFAPKSISDFFLKRFADLTIKLSLDKLKSLQSESSLINPSLLIWNSK